MAKKRPTSKIKSLPYLLKNLWTEGFFRDAKSMAEISKELANRGYYRANSVLGVALIRSVRMGGYLARVKAEDKWKYIQKHPPAPSKGERVELFSRYDLHPEIKRVAFSQFENKDFRGAILNAFIEIVEQVKVKTGRPKDKNGRDLDGDDLMNKIFGCDGDQVPQVKFNALRDSLDRAEQRGLMYLFKGVVGIRDKKAHLNFIQNDPLKTIEYLSLASLLLRLLDENVVKSRQRKNG
jgi:uncharacterized protein (TIGR02391 family)